MEKKQKKQVLNGLMVVIVLAIVAVGVFAVGSVKGWFSSTENSFFIFVPPHCSSCHGHFPGNQALSFADLFEAARRWIVWTISGARGSGSNSG